jgi:hypothetical protein
MRMIGNAAEADPSIMRSEYDAGASWMRAAKHPKRSTILHMIISLMAADFWKDANKITDNPDWKVVANPFRFTNSDVIVAEALIFFWYNFHCFIQRATEQKELSGSDIEALSTAGLFIGDTIQSNLQIYSAEVFGSRLREYEGRDASEIPAEVFLRVLLRSIGKQTINDPDHAVSPLGSDYQTPVMIRTAIYTKAMLPAYFQTYKNILEHYRMD